MTVSVVTSLTREFLAVAAFGTLFLAGNHTGDTHPGSGIRPLVLDWPLGLGTPAFAAASDGAGPTARLAKQAMRPTGLAGGAEGLARP